MPALRKPDDFWGDPSDIKDRLNLEKDERIKRKLQAVLLLMEGQSQKQTAQELNVSIASIRNWIRQWNTGGLKALRPRHIGTSRIDATIRIGMEQRGFQYKKLSSNFFAYIPTMAGPLDIIRKNSENPREPVVMRHVTQKQLLTEILDKSQNHKNGENHAK